MTILTQKIRLDEVLAAIEQDSRGKADYITPVNNLRVDNEGNFVFLRTGDVQGSALRDIPFDATEWAERQLMNRLGMPAQYFRKAKEEDPELFSRHFNHWANKAEGTIRLRTKVSGTNGLIRGAVSDKYSVLDNDMVGDTLKEILKGQEDNYQIEMFHLDDKRMHLRLTFLDLTKQLGVLPDGTPDYMRIGEDVINSEVGAASFNLLKMVWRLVCSNGLRRWDREDSFIQRHIHLRTIEFQGRVAEAMVNQLHAGQEFLQRFEETQRQRIQNPFAVITKLSKEGGFSRQFTDTAKESFEGDNTAYGVINAFTRAARDLPNERRLEAENFAGKLVDFAPNRWNRLDSIEFEDEEPEVM